MSKIQPDARNFQLRIRDRRSGTSEFNIIQCVNIDSLFAMQPFEPSDGCLALHKLMANGLNG
jgi:hypothetical protein